MYVCVCVVCQHALQPGSSSHSHTRVLAHPCCLLARMHGRTHTHAMDIIIIIQIAGVIVENTFTSVADMVLVLAARFRPIKRGAGLLRLFLRLFMTSHWWVRGCPPPTGNGDIYLGIVFFLSLFAFHQFSSSHVCFVFLLLGFFFFSFFSFLPLCPVQFVCLSPFFGQRENRPSIAKDTDTHAGSAHECPLARDPNSPPQHRTFTL